MRGTRPAVVAFDVNETLLDLAALDPLFERSFGSASVRQRWFAQMLQLVFVGGLTGRYVDYTTAQRAALVVLEQQTGRRVPEEERERIVSAMRALPAHADVPAALQRLRDGGLRVVTLTNSPVAVAAAQLDASGLRRVVDEAFSADQVRALKPAPEPYAMVAQREGVDIGQVMLVAAHGWDVSGALAAGCRAAFVARPGAVLGPLGPQPEIVGADVAAVVDRILAAPA